MTSKYKDASRNIGSVLESVYSLNSEKSITGEINLSKNRKLASRSAPLSHTHQQVEQQGANVVKLGNRNYRRVQMVPRNTAQETYLEALSEKRMVFAVGPAGTGKTLLATLYAISELKNGNISRIVLTRPAVSVDEELGALPGTLIEKLSPFIRPVIDVFEEYYSKQEIVRMMEDGTLEVCPLSYIRGRTFKNAVVILDEAQSTTPNQLKATLTRIGEGSKMIITGDIKQADYGRDGLSDFLQKYGDSDVHDIGIVRFDHKHIERDPIISSILGIYGDTD
jgi:phosphate starvation-inducible PhoH-like protein